MLSKGCEYDLAAAMYLAAAEQTGYVSTRIISDHLCISYPFLTKVLQQLNDAGLTVSMRGAHGGVALSQPPEQLTLKDIIVAIDGTALFTECVLGGPGCGTAKPCPLHERWNRIRGRLNDLFETTTLDEAAGMGDALFVELDALVAASDDEA